MSTTCHKPAARGLNAGGRSESGCASEADVSMDPTREQTVETFARQFTHFEWKYLCSYQWFIRDFARAVETDDFSSLRIKAERSLVEGGIRRPGHPRRDDQNVCHTSKWYD
ncbi:MAG: hypothetical protein JOZ08_01115 [Verrucomicrobia bacterium]|nr:hypothetical protein [Verrucomicrobiota bacterium]